MSIKGYSTTPASNTSLFPENMAPSAVNDGMRQVQADMRTWYQDAEWVDWGDSGISRASATTFKITGDVTSRYLVNRAIKCYDAATAYGVITAASYSAPDTTITVNLDSGSLTASLTSVAIGSLSPINRSMPTTVGKKGSDVASASTIDLSATGGTYVDITGTTGITAISTEAAGVIRRTRTTGALLFTHNATSLILPGAANITSAADDRQEWISLGGGNWLCFAYTRASGFAIATGHLQSIIPILSGVALASNIVANVTSITLTSGTWDVWGNVCISFDNVSTEMHGWISSTSATAPDDSLASSLVYGSGTFASACFTVPKKTFTVTTNTTVYLSAKAVYSLGVCSAAGGIYARQVLKP